MAPEYYDMPISPPITLVSVQAIQPWPISVSRYANTFKVSQNDFSTTGDDLILLRWRLGMNELLHLTEQHGCNYISIFPYQINYVSIIGLNIRQGVS